jgi:diguanylate cyclase (GGDEF)-like protein
MISWFESLSIPTIIIMVGIAFLMQAWATGIQFLLAKEYGGIRMISFANIVLAAGFLLIAFREALPEWLTIVLANALINLGLGLIYLSLCRFVGKKPDLPLFLGSMFASVVLLYYFTYSVPSLVGRIMVMSIATVPLVFATIRVLQSEETRTYRLGAGIINATFLAYGVVLIIRAIFTLIIPPASPFVSSPMQTLYYGGLFVTSYLWSAGFILMVSQRRQYNLNDLATKDPLTHVFNRREMVRLLEAEFGRRRRGNGHFSLLLLDVDHFKGVNDTHGHLVGDFVLSTLPVQLAGVIRSQDIIARWGGEEFLVLLPGTSYDVARLVGKRICTAIGEHAFEKDGLSVHITLSIGVASSDGNTDVDGIFKSADNALYAAKKRRNTVA